MRRHPVRRDAVRDQRRQQDAGTAATGNVSDDITDLVGHFRYQRLPTGIQRVQVEAVLAALPGADLLWVESPTNPLLEVADLPATAARALADPDVPDVEALPGAWASQRTDPTLLVTGVVAPEVPWEEGMGALRVPTLLVTGDRRGSARVGPEGLSVLERVANPCVETVLVPGAGHDVRRTRPVGFYTAVDPWLRRILDRSRDRIVIIAGDPEH